MGIIHGTNEIYGGKLKLGAGDISKVYLGNNKIWPAVPTFYEPTGTKYTINLAGGYGGANDDAGGVRSFVADIGPAGPNRLVVAMISLHDGDTTTLSNVKIGGVAATFIAGYLSRYTSTGGMWVRLVPTGTTCAIQWTGGSSGPGVDGYAAEIVVLNDAAIAGHNVTANAASFISHNSLSNSGTVMMAAAWEGGGLSVPWNDTDVLRPNRSGLQGFQRVAYATSPGVVNYTATIVPGTWAAVTSIICSFPRA